MRAGAGRVVPTGRLAGATNPGTLFSASISVLVAMNRAAVGVFCALGGAVLPPVRPFPEEAATTGDGNPTGVANRTEPRGTDGMALPRTG